jgi:hypothetical protein
MSQMRESYHFIGKTHKKRIVLFRHPHYSNCDRKRGPLFNEDYCFPKKGHDECHMPAEEMVASKTETGTSSLLFRGLTE